MAIKLRVLALAILFALIASPAIVSVQAHTASSFTVLVQEDGFSQSNPKLFKMIRLFGTMWTTNLI